MYNKEVIESEEALNPKDEEDYNTRKSFSKVGNSILIDFRYLH